MNNIESLGREIVIYGRNPDNTVYKTVDRNFQPYFYIPDDKGEFISIYGDKLKKIVISNPNDVFFEVRNYPVTFEGDVNYRIRYIIDKIEKLEKEPLRILYIDIEVDSSNGFPVPELAKMQMLSIGLYDSFDREYIVYYLGLDDYDIEGCKLIKCTTEQEMLTKFLDYLKEKDPDVIAGWNVDFDTYYIYNRIKNLNMNTNLLSRDRYNCYDNVKQKKVKFFGRFIFDLLEAYKIMIPDSRENYRLDTIGDIELGFGKHKFKGDLTNLYLTDKRNFLYYNMIDVKILVELDAKRHIINFFDELRRFVKCRFEDCFARSMMNDVYILNYAHKRGLIMPSKISVEHTEYEGAIVKRNVESGIYNNVASLDFASLYPSCILSCNMSPETFKLKTEIKDEELQEYICLENGVCFDKNIDGLVPSIIKGLFELRKNYRGEMRKYDMDSIDYNKFNSMQYSCKILLNSLYGLFGFSGSRIYNRLIADSVTLMARNVILHSEKTATQFGYKIAYIDTDSLFAFIDIKSDDVKKIVSEGFVLRDLVNNSIAYFCKQNYNIDRHYFKIQYEKFYSEIYFASVLKRYFGYIIWKEDVFLKDKKFHLMGFEGKRKDTPKVSQDMQKDLFKMILDRKSKEEIKVFLDDFILKVKTVYTSEEIALPISYGRENYKNNPINMRAINFSNEYFDMDIRLGDRVKYLFVTRANKYRTDVVAIKDELPSGFVVDYQQMLRRILWLKVSPVLNSLGYRDLLPVKNRVKIKEKNRNIFEYINNPIVKE